jgi:uroporphyrinogen decarboxylase
MAEKMTHRERFLATMRFQSVDRYVYNPALGYWGETLKRWRQEGLPHDADVNAYFGVDPSQNIGTYFGMCPAFEHKHISEDEITFTYINHEGILMRELKENSELSMPQFLEFPVKNAGDFKALLPRLQLNEPQRFPADWDERCANWRVRDYPLGLGADRESGFYGSFRNLMGLENLSMAYYDDPKLIEMMTENRVELMLDILGKVFKSVTLDWFIFWEDMCYNHASLLSPAMFKKYMVPAYRKVCDFLRKNGVDIIFVDSDGNIDELIPLWLEGGLTGIYPMEVQSGSDVVRYRAEYGKDLCMTGGIDKKCLLKSRRDILDEIRRVMPVVESGGYIPGIDHSVPPDVSFENFNYYIAELASALGVKR